MTIRYTLVRSRRKTVGLYVRDGAVEVRAPWGVPKRDINRFVASKERWITEKLEDSVRCRARREGFRLTYGDCVAYRGRAYPIAADIGGRAGFDGQRFYMPPKLQPEQIKAACVQIYRLLAKRDVTEKALRYAKEMSVKPAAVRINGARTHWGSCSARGNLNFSWRLIMADDDVIDYVVVHELAHLTEMNHSARFWAIVEDVVPDYRQKKEGLKALRKKLGEEDWEG